MRTVYIMLTRTLTYPARLIHMMTRDDYTHASLSLDLDSGFYSFARRRINNPLIAGFIHEELDKGIFALYPDQPCAIYSLKVTDATYNKLKHYINEFMSNYDDYKYNFIGCVTSYIGVKRKLSHRYTCSQFVADILQRSGAVKMPSDPSLMMPMDLASLPQLTLIYKGTIHGAIFIDPRIPQLPAAPLAFNY